MTLEIVFWDVQHGNATYIKTPNGKHIVQDLGTGSYNENNISFSPLKRLKQKYGVDQLDEVIITHPHKDHIDDIFNFDELHPRILSRPRIPKDEILKNSREQDRALFEKYIQISDRYSDPVEPSENPLSQENNGGVKFNIFYPKSQNNSNINNLSSVTVISYADSKIILPGDNESSSWKELIHNPEFQSAIRGADILLASHHGRESGFYPDLFDYFKPKLTIISDGQVCDTTAVDRYRKYCQGWKVFHEDIRSEDRYCLTTRNDGVIIIKIGYRSDTKPYIQVKIK